MSVIRGVEEKEELKIDLPNKICLSFWGGYLLYMISSLPFSQCPGQRKSKLIIIFLKMSYLNQYDFYQRIF